MTDDKSDYLAIIPVAGGGGSWARSGDREKVLRDVKRRFKADWASLIACPKGKQVQVALWNVTGHGDLWWEGVQVHDEVDDKPLPRDRYELVELTY